VVGRPGFSSQQPLCPESPSNGQCVQSPLFSAEVRTRKSSVRGALTEVQLHVHLAGVVHEMTSPVSRGSLNNCMEQSPS
jgi:hypothetical protein